jgi:homoserine O-succinyltransferase/O-acetyltransferase
MPVRTDSSRSRHDRRESTTRPGNNPPSQLPDNASGHITIGLINNMPDAAFEATERQFVTLLDSASEGIPIHLSLYTLPGISRPESNGDSANSVYSSAETLVGTRLDGLIVTGREPTTPNLRDEPYWDNFTKVLKWARDNTHSTVWSCLAAHAAILHLDGISRRKSDDKHFGVFECAHVSGHRLTAGASSRFHIPHSRWNGIAEEELEASGYSILTRTANAGVDTFVKQDKSLFVFFQGHPEYESNTLLREYRRDVGRYLRGEATTYPSIPRGYFDRSTEGVLTALRENGMSGPSEELLANVTAALEEKEIENTWRSTATHIYRNWLEYICERKNASQLDGQVNAACSVLR